MMLRAVIAFLALLVMMPTVVAAQRFSTRPLRIIVPLPAGATSRIN
jgi:tripartite-type tricarboxylate transporter receptor subunit TctC